MTVDKELKKARKLQELVADALGKTVEEVYGDATVETTADKMVQAESVLLYWETRGAEWVIKICKGCGRRFAHYYHVAAVASCSVRCMSKRLRDIGLKWNPHQENHLRWGKYYPAIVPPDALEILDEMIGSQQDPQQHKSQ